MDEFEKSGVGQNDTAPTEETEPKIVFEPVYEPPIVMQSTLLVEEMQETKEFKKTALFCGIAYLVMYLFLQIVNKIPQKVLLWLGFAPVKVVEILSDPVVLQLEQISFSILLFTLPFISVFKIGRWKIGEIVAFNKPKTGNFINFVVIGAGFCVLANIAASYMSNFFGGIGVNYDFEPIQTPEGPYGLALAFVSTVLTPALLEEFACRGIVFGALKKYGDGAAIFGSALLFGLMHGNFEQMPFTFFVGLALGYVTAKSGSVLPAMAIHAWNNFVSFFFTDVIGFSEEIIIEILYNGLMAVVLIAAVACFAKLSAEKFDFNLCENGSRLKFGRKCKIFLLSPTVLVYALICIFRALRYFG